MYTYRCIYHICTTVDEDVYKYWNALSISLCTRPCWEERWSLLWTLWASPHTPLHSWWMLPTALRGFQSWARPVFFNSNIQNQIRMIFLYVRNVQIHWRDIYYYFEDSKIQIDRCQGIWESKYPSDGFWFHAHWVFKCSNMPSEIWMFKPPSRYYLGAREVRGRLLIQTFKHSNRSWDTIQTFKHDVRYHSNIRTWCEIPFNHSNIMWDTIQKFKHEVWVCKRARRSNSSVKIIYIHKYIIIIIISHT